MRRHHARKRWLVPMRKAVRWGVPAAIALAAPVAGGAIFWSLSARDASSVALYMLANVVLFTDLFDFLLRLHLRRVNGVVGANGRLATSIAIELGDDNGAHADMQARPFAIVVSVHNAEGSIDRFLEAMHAYRERCWIIDDASTDATVQRVRHAGWRCLEGVQNRKKPGAIRRLLHALPPEIETVIVVDPDIAVDDMHPSASTLETVVLDFQRSGLAAVSPRLAVRPEGVLPRFQALEYGMSFSLGRMSLADFGINSGISVYRRSALTALLEQHSLSVYAEDFENSLILLGAGERIYYDSRLVVMTDVPESLPGWFSQRVGWSFGLLKVYVERFDDIRRVARRCPSAAYQFLGYTGISCLAMQPLKIAALVVLSLSFANGFDGLLGLDWIPEWSAADPIYFVATYGKYTLLAGAALLVAVPRGERAAVAPIVPLYFFYALLQVVPTTVGYANWISLHLVGGRLFADHYQDEGALRQQHASRLSGRVAVPVSSAGWRRAVSR